MISMLSNKASPSVSVGVDKACPGRLDQVRRHPGILADRMPGHKGAAPKTGIGRRAALYGGVSVCLLAGAGLPSGKLSFRPRRPG
jgi:hypothetical protein